MSDSDSARDAQRLDTPSAAAAGISADQQAEAKAYGRRQLCCTIADMAIDLGYIVLFTLLWAIAADRWLASFDGLQNRWLRLAAYYLLLNAGQTAASLPLAVYSGFILEHQYKLSRQSFPRWLGRYALQYLLATVLGLALIEGLFLVVHLTGPAWWIVAACAFFCGDGPPRPTRPRADPAPVLQDRTPRG